MPRIANASGTGSYYYASMGSYYSQVSEGNQLVELSSTFTSSNFVTVLGPVDVSAFNSLGITVVNNSVNNLISGTIQTSPDSVNWSTLSSFSALTSSGIFTASYSFAVFKYLRIQALASGTGGGQTGSLDCFVLMN